MKKVFLAGSLVSNWRNEIIPMLLMDYFNPKVPKSTKKTRDEEELQYKECDYILYVITPDDFDICTIINVVQDSNKRPEKTILCCPKKCYNTNLKFTKDQINILKHLVDIVCDNNAILTDDLLTAAGYLNSHK